MPVYRITFEATPSASHPLTHEVGGAFINAWVEDSSSTTAAGKARRFLTGEGWLLDEPDEVSEVDVDLLNDEGRNCLRAARRNGGHYTVHIYPIVDEADPKDREG